ncbi:MAG: hypothetical protein AAF690_16410 [Acidobacteriota bacterium]
MAASSHSDPLSLLLSGARSPRAMAVCETAAVGWLAVVFCLPFPLRHLGPGLDRSMHYALAELFVRGAGFGREVIHQYGPYGFVRNTVFHPQTIDLLIWFQLFFAATLGMSLLVLGRRLVRHRGLRVLWIFATLLVISRRDVLYVCLPLLLWLLVWTEEARPRKMTVPLLALCFAMALGSLVKFTFFIAAVAGLLALGVALWSERRPASADLALALFGLYLTAVVGLWLLAEQPLSSLPDYVIHRLHLTLGYAATHAKQGPSAQPIVFALLWIAQWVALALSPLRDVVSGSKLQRLCALALSGALLFLTFKHSFVRHDRHALNAVFMTLSLTLLFAPLFAVRRPAHDPGAPSWPRAASRRRALQPSWLLAVLAVSATVSADWLHRAWAEASLPGWAAGEVGASVHAVRTALEHARDPYTSTMAWRSAMRRARSRLPLDDLEGSVDLLGDDLSPVLASGLPLDLRPTLQQYQAADAALAEASVRAVIDGPPDRFLVGLSRIDHRLMALADGPLWVELLRSYSFEEPREHHLLLRRRNEPATLFRGAERARTVTWGQELPLDLEPRTVAWMQVNVRQTLLGHLASALLKGPTLHIEVELRDGKRFERRFLASAGRTGFVVSPSIEATPHFRALARNRWNARLRRRQVRSVTFTTSNPWLVEEALEVRWHRVAFSSGR